MGKEQPSRLPTRMYEIADRPEPDFGDDETKGPLNFAVGAVAMLVACFILLGLNLGTRDLWEPEELRYAEIAREMKDDGNWILLHFNQVPYPDKPPLFFWSICLASKLTGGLRETAARLPSALAGTATVMLIYVWIAYTVSVRAGLLVGAVLLAMPFFAWTSVEARMDMPLTFLVTLACISFHFNHLKEGDNKWLHRLFWASMALGVLTKGVPGLLPLLIAAAYLAMVRDLHYFREMRLVEGLSIMAVIVGVWLVPACLMGGKDFTTNILFRQNVGRVTSPWLHRNPPWHFFPVLPYLMLPWALFIPAALFHPWSAESAEDRREVRFLFLWVSVVFVFFSLIPSKRTIYLMPLLPAVGALTGLVLEDCVFKDPQRRFWRVRLPFYVTVPAMALAAIGGVSVARRLLPGFSGRFLELCVVVVTGAAISAFFMFWRRFEVASAVFIISVALAWGVASHRLLPVIDRFKSPKPMLESVRQRVGEDKLGIFRDERTGYAFYWGSHVPIVRHSGPHQMRAPRKEDEKRDFLAEDRKALAEHFSQAPSAWVLIRTKEIRELADSGISFRPVSAYGVGGRHHILITNKPYDKELPDAGRNLVDLVFRAGKHATSLKAEPCSLIEKKGNGVRLRAFCPTVKVILRPVGEAGGVSGLEIQVDNVNPAWTKVKGLLVQDKPPEAKGNTALLLRLEGGLQHDIVLQPDPAKGGSDNVPVAVIGGLAVKKHKPIRIYRSMSLKKDLIASIRQKNPAFAIALGKKTSFGTAAEYPVLDSEFARMGIPVYGAPCLDDRRGAGKGWEEHTKRFGLPPLGFQCAGCKVAILDSSLGFVTSPQLEWFKREFSGEKAPIVFLSSESPIVPGARKAPSKGYHADFLGLIGKSGGVRVYCSGFRTAGELELEKKVFVTGGAVYDDWEGVEPGPHWVLCSFSRTGVREEVVPLRGK